MLACAKNAFGHWARSTRPACLQGELGGQVIVGGAPPISEVVSSLTQKPLPANLKPAASLSRQPLVGQVTIFWTPTNWTPAEGLLVEGVWKGLTGHGMLSLWVISLLWSSAKDMWVAKPTSRFSLQITLLMIRERKADSSSTAPGSSPPTPYTKSVHLGNFYSTALGPAGTSRLFLAKCLGFLPASSPHAPRASESAETGRPRSEGFAN